MPGSRVLRGFSRGQKVGAGRRGQEAGEGAGPGGAARDGPCSARPSEPTPAGRLDCLSRSYVCRADGEKSKKRGKRNLGVSYILEPRARQRARFKRLLFLSPIFQIFQTSPFFRFSRFSQLSRPSSEFHDFPSLGVTRCVSHTKHTAAGCGRAGMSCRGATLPACPREGSGPRSVR